MCSKADEMASLI